jgi:hypothetical protein
MSSRDADEAVTARTQETPGDYSDVPHFELDQLLGQLVDRAQNVIAAQDRLRAP